MNAQNIANWLKIARSVVEDYRLRIDIPEKILSQEDFNNLVLRLNRLIDILESNQTKFNIILNLIQFITSLRGKN